ncbi:hypothetical protein C3486_07010 [Streptomyces sp. Ru73]|uniref:hypothetical protein n=1 Tax=Streptomyces sp. Ru73 TaxID=2080748 RepID=UPI000CDD7A8B|nr:hypothetical protein [Streptomyces sp. Ru73]POX41963.1 hypothetical protein C3486_07010 [Streptomyces sp. Ru73]
MKLAKTAAVLAGSVVALGAATPAFAATDHPSTSPSMSLNAGLNDALANAGKAEVDPVVDNAHKVTHAAAAGDAEGLLDGATGLAGHLPLAGLPLGK